MNFKTICSFFSCTAVHTDEEYRKVLIRRRRFFIGMLILGIITVLVATCAEFLAWDTSLSSHTLGFYCGVGTGLSFGAVVLLLRLRKTMMTQDALRAARIRDTDERTQEIGRRALAAAGYALLIAVYLFCFIGGLFYPELLVVLGCLVSVFLVTYIISFFIYNKSM